MKIKSGPIIAVVLFLGLLAWILMGGEPAQVEPETVAESTDTEIPKVKAEVKFAQTIDKTLKMDGHTAARRIVEVRSEASGRVTKVLKQKGDFVEKGQLLIEVDTEEFVAQLTSARALEKQRKLELEGAQSLVKRGLQNTTELAAATAMFEQARAQRVSLELNIKHAKVKAPFSGFVNSRPVELGSFVSIGDMVAEIYDFKPLVVEVQASENDVHYIKPGMTAIAKLPGDVHVEATARFISSSANPVTRTFSIEFDVNEELPNPVAGTTASIEIPVATTWAHFISPALLILDDNGLLGVKTLDDDNKVHFNNIEIAESNPKGIWVTGLPEMVKLITVGQGFVNENQLVEASFSSDDGAESSSAALADATEE